MSLLIWLAKQLGYKEPEGKTFWETRVLKFALENAPENRVVLVGDSITQGWEGTHYLKDCVNYGIAGDTSTGVLARINQILKAKPSKVILNIGTNDIGMNALPNVTIANYEKIITSLTKQMDYDDIICCAIRPINPTYPTVAYRNNAVNKIFNKAIKQLCQDNLCVYEPDTYSCHVVPDGQGGDVMNPHHTIDGLHLSDEGYKAEIKILNKYIHPEAS
jgi:lysophospholipase L1-like esterase